jgi:16S rRNA (cytidine1402-2'-O)-methyltransferase
LYLVATPIGNLGDITLRALEILRGADLIACEDTRITRRLLSHYGVATPTTAYHDHNAPTALPRLIKRLQKGEIVALVSDAGTPLVSDPGYRLVQTAISEGIPVTTAPGPVAAIAALTLAGLPTDSFLFAGFLPAKQGARRHRLEALSGVPAALIFYESPRRVPATLAEMADCLGDRPAAVVREITKLYEEVRRGSLGELAAAFAQSGPPRGEVVLVVGPPAPQAGVDDTKLDTMLDQALETMSLRDAVDHVTAASGRQRRDVYQRALALSAGERAE